MREERVACGESVAGVLGEWCERDKEDLIKGDK